MDTKIGDKIRQRRKEMGFTLKELAGVRITPAQISAIENNKCNPSAGLLEYLCERLQVDSEYFTMTNEQKLRRKFEQIKKICDECIEAGEYEKASNEVDKLSDLLGRLDDAEKGFFHFVKGFAAYESEEYMKAFDCYVKSVAHFIKTKEIDRIADLYTKLGNSLYHMKNFDMAIGYYRNAYQMMDKLLDNDLRCKIMFNMAICYSELERPVQCTEMVDKCYEFMEHHEVKKRDNLLPGLEMLKGLMLMHEQENDVGMQNFIDAYEKYKADEDLIGMGRALFNLGMKCWNMGKLDEAIDFMKQSVEMKCQTDEKNVVDAFVHLSRFYAEKGNYEEASQIISVAEEKMIGLDFKEGISEVFIAKFELLCKQEDFDRAEIFAYLALDTIQKSGIRMLESSMYVKLSEMYKKMGDEKSALENLMKANEITMRGEVEKLHNPVGS